MLDSSLLEQLKSVFGALENTVELVYENSSHEDQKDLLDMLQSVASTSDKITLTQNASGTSPMPQFRIDYKGKHTGIVFKGIPGGHEFTSLILAILNTDGKGKLLDSVIADRVRRLNKNITVQSYISLTCENCPEVVQALNQIALIHGSLRHEIIDGGYVQDDIKSLGIQGVPSLVANAKMFHSGRIQLLDLVSKLESTFGVDANAAPSEPVNKNLGHFDVLVIGGGPAGASAAIYTVRKGLSTAMITEKIGGQVQETKGIENLIGVTYTEGPALAAQLNQHIASYPVKVLENRRVKKIHTENKVKAIELESGEHLTADSIIVTTGAKWRELGVEGEKEYLGRGVAYCPHCDGPFYKGKKVAVIGGGNSGVEAAIDLAGIVREVVVFEYNDQLKADKILVDKLKSLPNVSIVTSAKTEKVIGDGSKVQQIQYLDRSLNKEEKMDLDGIFVQIGLVPNSQFLKETVELTKFGEIIVDEKGRTSAKGIYAAGDVTTTPYKQIVIAMGEGAKAALAAFEDRMYHS
ncbi:alkyl hydroperoxide reductase subunit F [Bdellovibrio bacteriovorus]|uniref:Alkyl hydroperoxide reductase, subunit F n=1 Tax=Bdellovibrio bacteriovorus str. Tiberius TaxID=1069642 RepID=K7ZB67_BDEBC|nr:alkyl hydroperoxide reductase subunit F [Bdellovibrio bacteriovorus]AFY02139.1 alkyl hydroperoxide reductase, subunit F [Bdellovibrio bacteriovorus str. Tiberius]